MPSKQLTKRYEINQGKKRPGYGISFKEACVGVSKVGFSSSTQNTKEYAFKICE
jgi:hypothetical protein